MHELRTNPAKEANLRRKLVIRLATAIACESGTTTPSSFIAERSHPLLVLA